MVHQKPQRPNEPERRKKELSENKFGLQFKSHVKSLYFK